MAILFASTANLLAQGPEYKYENPHESEPSPIPFYEKAMNPAEEFRAQWLYFPDDFSVTIPTGRDISTLYFKAFSIDTVAEFLEFTVLLKQDSMITLDDKVWEPNLTQVKYSQRLRVDSLDANKWFKIELDTVFSYDPGLPLVVEVAMKDVTKGMLMDAGGLPLNPANAQAITRVYGAIGRATPNVGDQNLYDFGFDLNNLNLDANLVAISSPTTFCAGVQDVEIMVANKGVQPIDSIEVYWELNGVAQTTIKYKQGIDAVDGNNPTATILLGSHDFQGPTDIKVYLANPNGSMDEDTSNDTLEVHVGPGLVAGTYTLDNNLSASATNFVDIESLTYSLNQYGVCGPVVINIAAGVYTERMHLKNIPGVSDINTVTIDGGDSSQTIITKDGGRETDDFSPLVLDNVQYVTIKNMGFNHTGQDVGATVVVTSGSSYNTITNCNMWLNPSASLNSYRNIMFADAPSEFLNQVDNISNNVFSNNNIIGGYYGIFMTANATYTNKNNKFLNNVIDSVYYYAAHVSYMDSIEFIGNTFNVLNSTNSITDGFFLQYSPNAIVAQNNIKAKRYGLYLVNNTTTSAFVTRPTEVSNNMIYSVNNVGLRVYYVSSVNVYHNSIKTASTSEAVNFTTNASNPLTNYDVRNNIFSNAGTGRAFYSNLPPAVYTNFDYNLFHTAGANVISFNNSLYSDILLFQQAYPAMNQNSLQADPEFVSATDLHVDGMNVFQKGDNSLGIIVDIDGDERPMPGLDSVSIGADEFFPTGGACPFPVDLAVANVSFYLADIHWLDTSSAQNYEYVLLSCDSNFRSGTPIASTSDSLTITGLEENSCYKYYVRNLCSATDSSYWAGPYSFTTLEMPYYPIGEINTSDVDGVADSIGVYGLTSGTVVGLNLHEGNGLSFTIIDMSSGEQEGIHVYSDTIVSAYAVEEGDSVMLRGEVSQSFGLVEFLVDSIEVLTFGNAIPEAISVTTLDETTESKLVKLENFIVLDPVATGTYDIVAANETDTITITINELTDVSDSLVGNLEVGDTLCSIVGIGSQYDASTSAPYLSGYYLAPMYYSDIVICKSTVGIRKNVAFTSLAFYPNPTNGNFTIVSTGLESDNAVITIRDVSGRVILEESINNSNKAFKKDYNLSEQAKGIYFISIIDGNNRITKKLILK